MERDLEVDNLIEELDTLSNSFKFQNTSYDKTKLKANLSQEDFEKYTIVNNWNIWFLGKHKNEKMGYKTYSQSYCRIIC